MLKFTFNNMLRFTLTTLSFALVVMFSSCAEKVVKSNEIIKVSYFPGLQDFNIRLSADNFHLKDIVPSDTIFLGKEDYYRIKEYIHSNEAKLHNKKVDVRLIVTEGTDTAFMGVCLFDEDVTERVMDVEYLIKAKSRYYNFFRKEHLGVFKEVEKNGIPADYRFVDRSEMKKHEEMHSVAFSIEAP